MPGTAVVDLIDARLRDLHIIPLTRIQSPQINDLAEDLADSGFRVTIEGCHSLPEQAYHQDKKRYAGQIMLDYLRHFGGGRILGVMDQIIYSYVIQNIKGMADFAGRAAVISMHQLLPTKDSGLLRNRLCKLAVHELGHTYGLEHCDNCHCVMHDGKNMAVWDLARSTFCDGCHWRLKDGPYLDLL